ncbi:MAG: DinB family protein [Gemmatimonadota bacterium]
MNKQTLGPVWDQTRQKYGVYLRILESIPEDRYHSHPIAGMKSPAELVAHVSGSIVLGIAQGVAQGAITANEADEAKTAAALATKADAIAFATKCWDQANEAVTTIGDAQLSAMVPTPWDMTFPGWVGFNILSDEFLHHRGQLSAYARVCGATPPFIWGFGDNAPEFRPVS